MRKLQAGWRHFHCEECGRIWSETTRDYASPSGDNCSNCGAWCNPVWGEPDATLDVDKNTGNLNGPYQTIVKSPGEPQREEE